MPLLYYFSTKTCVLTIVLNKNLTKIALNSCFSGENSVIIIPSLIKRDFQHTYGRII